MNDSPFTTIGDEPVEARIVAWVLGEASAFEAAELERLCDERPELLVFRRRMRALHGLLTEAEAAQPDEGWKLPADKRQVLDEVFGDDKVVPLEVEKEKRIRRSGRRAFLAIAACLVLTAVVMGLLGPAGIRKAENAITGLSRSDAPAAAESPADKQRELENLRRAVQNQEDKLEERRKVLSTITRQKGIVYRGDDSFFNQSSVDEDQGAKSALQTYHQLEQEKMQLESQISSLLKYDSDQLMTYAAGLDLPDNIIRNLLPEYQEAKRQLEGLKIGGLSDRHPTVLSASSQTDNMKIQLDEGVVNLRASLKAQLDVTADRLKSVEAMKDGTREDAIKRGLDAQDYVDAKRDFESDEQVLQNLKLKLAVEEVSSRIEGETLAANQSKPPATGLVPLASRLPEELIEGTPKPMNVPNLEAPVNGPAGSSSWGRTRARIAGTDDKPVEMAERPRSFASEPSEPVAGLRSGDQAINRNSIDAILNNPNRTVPAAPPSMPSPLAAARLSRTAVPVSDAAIEDQLSVMGGADDFGDGSGNKRPNVRRTVERDFATKSEPAAATPAPAAVTAAPTLDGGKDRNSVDAIPQITTRSLDLPMAGKPAAVTVTGGVDLDLSANESLAKGQAAAGGFGGGGGGSASQGPAELNLDDSIRIAGAKEKKLAESQTQLPDDGTEHAMDLRKVGKYTEARDQLEKVLTADPNNVDAKREIDYLNDPVRTNPALTYEHAQNVDNVRRKLYTAEGNYNLGKYDDAKREYENTLRIDPYNSAARRGLERVASAKSDYYRAAYDHTRSELLSQVDAAWELSVPADEKAPAAGQDTGPNSDRYSYSTYTGYRLNTDSKPGEPMAGGALGLDAGVVDQQRRLGEQAAAASAFSLNGPDSKLGAADFAYYWDTSKVKESDSRSGEVEYEVHAGYSSDYFFKGADLAMGDKPALPPVDFEGFVNYGKPIADGEPQLPAQAGLNVVREFQYPTEYEAPEKPNAASVPAAMPVTPATPTTWMSRDEGSKADVSEIAASEDPYSTFSLNISDASFKIAQAALAKGERPDPAGIKVEQFYNAVDYGDPAPSAGEPVAVAIEQSAHPVIPGRNLVRVALKTAAAGRSASQPLRLTLLVDQSGSMVREDRRAAMDKALAGLTGLLTKDDLVTVIGFSRTPRLLADGMSGDQAAKLKDLVNQSASEGGTNLEEAIKLAEQLADRRKLAGAQNRIVLFTDGAANLGNADPVRLAEKVKNLRQKGIAFDIAGIAADGLNDELLGELARNGNGRYYVVGKGADENFAKQLAGAFRPAAENVKVQVRFNPERVGHYKLIGFEKDRLKTEDFRNDAVDAAELAAEEAGIGIYQVETLPAGKGELGEVSVRFRDAASGQMVERTWTVPHDGGAPAIDRATPSMQLATLAMLAAEKLKGGPLAEAIDFKQLADPQANVKRFYGTNGRAGEILNMVDALK